MAEQQKVVGRSIAIILGAICVVLAVGMVVALIAYLPAASQIDALNSQVTQKNQSITALNSEIAALNSQISSQNGQNSTTSNAALQLQISQLQDDLNSLNNVVYMNASGTLVSSQSFSLDSNTNATVWNQDNAPLVFPGYVIVQLSSSSNTTFVELSYAAYGVIYDNIVKLGTSGQTAFPVLPGSITIALGNTETNATVKGTVTATYYY